MVAKGYKNTSDSPKGGIGEIDTSAPFQSVKDAVTLFGEGALSGEKPTIKRTKPYSAERVLVKETQLHLAQKELSKLKEQLKNAETTKAQALLELEKAKKTVEDLTQKLRAVIESKDVAIKATEAVRNQAIQLGESSSLNSTSGVSWKHELEVARKDHMVVVTELDAAKQELRTICQDCDVTMVAKANAIKQIEEARHLTTACMERAGEISKEIAAVQESIGQVKLATKQAQQEEANIYEGKDVRKQTYRSAMDESTKKLFALKKDIDPELTQNLEVQLAETMSEIGALQNEMETARASDLESVRTVTMELDDARESLHKVVEEESSLRSLVESLKVELENVKREHSELKGKESATESIAGSLHVKLRKSKMELEAAMAEESKVRSSSEEMISTLHQLSSETENARQETEEMKQQTEALKEAAEATRMVAEEAEKQLRVALEEAEAAKVAEVRALDQIQMMSERTNAARASTSESGGQITISKEEFESLSRKVDESDKLAEMKVAAAMAQVEAVKASENQALQKLETKQKEIDDMNTATQEAVKRAEMAEAAKKAVEGELRRWREREQKKAVDAASRILAEAENSKDSSPQSYQGPKVIVPEKVKETLKLEKTASPVSKKVLVPNLSGIFNRKRNQVEGGSPSYLPGEKPV